MITARFKQFQVIANEHGVVSGIFGLDQNGELWSRRESDGEWTKLRMPERQVDNRTPFEKLLDAQEQLRKAEKAVVDEKVADAEDQDVIKRDESPAEVAERFSKLVDWKERMKQRGDVVTFTHVQGNESAALVAKDGDGAVLGRWDIAGQKEF